MEPPYSGACFQSFRISTPKETSQRCRASFSSHPFQLLRGATKRRLIPIRRCKRRACLTPCRNLCFLTSKVFKALWPRCHTPPTKELIEGYFKLAKGSQEKQIKEAAYRAIKTVVKANPSNFFQISQDIFKLIQKQIGSNDKEVVVVKGPIVACLRAFV